MKNYQFIVKFETGESIGSIQAKSKKAALKSIADIYESGDNTDGAANQPIKIVSLEIEEIR